MFICFSKKIGGVNLLRARAVFLSSMELFDMFNVSGDEVLFNLLYICTRHPVRSLNQDKLVTYLNSVFPEA